MISLETFIALSPTKTLCLLIKCSIKLGWGKMDHFVFSLLQSFFHGDQESIPFSTFSRNNLSMKEGSLFCFVVMRSRMLWILFLVSLESSWRGGLHGLVASIHDVWTCSAKVLEYWMISLLKIKLNQIVAENFGGIGMCLWCCWKDLDEQDLMEFIW